MIALRSWNGSVDLDRGEFPHLDCLPFAEYTRGYVRLVERLGDAGLARRFLGQYTEIYDALTWIAEIEGRPAWDRGGRAR